MGFGVQRYLTTQRKNHQVRIIFPIGDYESTIGDFTQSGIGKLLSDSAVNTKKSSIVDS